MRAFLVLVLAVCLGQLSSGQILVGVWTDKSVYNFGDTVAVTVTAYNATADTIDLYFSSACQAGYIIDKFRLLDSVGCAHVESMQRIPPHDVFQWPPIKYPFYYSGWHVLSPGPHTIVGEVKRYAFSDTLLITVKPPTSVPQIGAQTINFVMNASYPNPFNGETTIPFSLSTSDRVVVSIYTSLGQLARVLLDKNLTPGSHEVRANLGDLSSGMYWCCVQVGGRRQTQRLVLAK